jgi:hypothetical protein
MRLKLLEEPLLQFGNGQSICPKVGIRNFSPYDLENVRPTQIALGMIGKSESVEKMLVWINRCKKEVHSGKKKLLNLFPAFPGFNINNAFTANIVYDNSYFRRIKNSDIEAELKQSKDLDMLTERLVNVFIEEIKFLSKNKNPDVILCILDEELTKTLHTNNEIVPQYEKENDEEDERESSYLETNFRRLLKAKAMAYRIPIQIVRDKVCDPSSDMQDPATIAWNFFTAIYYKASGTPWALTRDNNPVECFAGISFYKSRDRTTTQTSVTQIFNEHGKGVILRGAEIELKKGDKEPHLNDQQAFDLMDKALKEYYEALKHYPQRMVIHKSSNFNESEIEGFKQAVFQNHIHSLDLVTIMGTPLRLFREKEYPAFRGTFFEFDRNNYLLYTRGYVNHFETYPGKYIPNPIQFRLFSHDESPERIAKEILGLSKMNWNNTQFDRKFPITLECSRKVGDIMKYLTPDETPEIRYSFYM